VHKKSETPESEDYKSALTKASGAGAYAACSHLLGVLTDEPAGDRARALTSYEDFLASPPQL